MITLFVLVLSSQSSTALLHARPTPAARLHGGVRHHRLAGAALRSDGECQPCCRPGGLASLTATRFPLFCCPRSRRFVTTVRPMNTTARSRAARRTLVRAAARRLGTTSRRYNPTMITAGTATSAPSTFHSRNCGSCMSRVARDRGTSARNTPMKRPKKIASAALAMHVLVRAFPSWFADLLAEPRRTQPGTEMPADPVAEPSRRGSRR